ncbi:tRNA guanosine18-2'-O-methyltransferase [Hondaea fermentalgiana]|uniref:tRNA guanosine18-2'-O-methyltransferase n=1 Tax=Hondaea fermentalgiana TaxID=2315210 RepID=A0A2R5GW45_9STRA|nr:tRNA guanosine18-2'-O-methyltransferase [Hondaea fermentalgiana]|eukprot:GBG34795.1 tRNA guanosine18-2'-O-methyltransferase [Hondaea fermentalgiana]
MDAMEALEQAVEAVHRALRRAREAQATPDVNALARLAWRQATLGREASMQCMDPDTLQECLRAAVRRERKEDASDAREVLEAVAKAIVETSSSQDREGSRVVVVEDGEKVLLLELVVVNELLFTGNAVEAATRAAGNAEMSSWGSAALENWLVERFAMASPTSRPHAIDHVVRRASSAASEEQLTASLRFIASLLGQVDPSLMDTSHLERLEKLCMDNVHIQGCVGTLLPRLCGTFGLAIADTELLDKVARALWDKDQLLESLRRLTLVFAACEKQRAVETRLLGRLRTDAAVWQAIRAGLEQGADMPGRQALFLLDMCVAACPDPRWRKLVDVLKGLAQMERQALKRTWTQLATLLVTKTSGSRDWEGPAFAWSWARIALCRALAHRNTAFAAQCSVRLLDLESGQGIFSPDADFLARYVFASSNLALYVRDQVLDRLEKFASRVAAKDSAPLMLRAAGVALASHETFMAARPLCIALAQRSSDNALLGDGTDHSFDKLEALIAAVENLAEARQHPVFAAAVSEQLEALRAALDTFAIADGNLEHIGRLAYALYLNRTQWKAWSSSWRTVQGSVPQALFEAPASSTLTPRARAGLLIALLVEESGQEVLVQTVAAWARLSDAEKLTLALQTLCPVIAHGMKNDSIRQRFEHGLCARSESLLLLDWAQAHSEAKVYDAFSAGATFPNFGPRLAESIARTLESTQLTAPKSSAYWALVKTGAHILSQSRWSACKANLLTDFDASDAPERWNAMHVLLQDPEHAGEALQALMRALAGEAVMSSEETSSLVNILQQHAEYVFVSAAKHDVARLVLTSPRLTAEQKVDTLFSNAQVIKHADTREAVLRPLWGQAATSMQQGSFKMLEAVLDAQEENAWAEEIFALVTRSSDEESIQSSNNNKEGPWVDLDTTPFLRLMCLEFLTKIVDRNPSWALSFAKRLKDMAYTNASASSAERRWAARAFCVLGSNLRGISDEAVVELFEGIMNADFDGLREEVELRWILETAMLALLLQRPESLMRRLVARVERCDDLEQLLSYVYVLTSGVYYVSDQDIDALRKADASTDTEGGAESGLVSTIVREAVSWAASENLSVRTLGPALLSMLVERKAWGVDAENPLCASLYGFVRGNLHAQKTADKALAKVRRHGMDTMARPWHHFCRGVLAESVTESASLTPSNGTLLRRGELLASLVSKVPNVAGLIRTADVLGLSEITISQFRFLKNAGFPGIACSAEDFVPVREVPYADLGDYIRKRKAAGCRVLALEQAAESVSIEDYKFPMDVPVCFLLGMEKEGVPMHLLNLVDDCIEIPQFGLTRSLNVHASGSILLWEYVKQQQRSKTHVPQV